MHRKKIAGFSLTELMVVVGILGILATIAIPRYNSFIVQSRRAEAKSHLHQIATLQEAFRAEHGGYYYSSAMQDKGVGYKDGNGKLGDCTDYPDADDKGLTNRLGFRPKDCDKLRYVYKLSGANVVIASAASDANKRHIFPDCNGPGDCYECGYNTGDALLIAMSSANPVVCRNINKYCPDGASCIGTPLPPPTPPVCVCDCSLTLGTEQTSDPTKYVCEHSTLTRVDHYTCTRGPPGCVGGAPDPCPVPPPNTEDYNVNGSKPLLGPPPAPDAGDTYCGCDGTPDPRPACNPATVCNCTTDPCPTTPPTGVDTSTKYPCQYVTENVNVTKRCTPTNDPPCTPPYNSTVAKSCTFSGTKPITCDNICDPWSSWSAWSDCERRSAGYCDQRRTKTRTCTNECPMMNIVDAHGNPVPSCQEIEFEKPSCLCPEKTCVAGSNPASLVGMVLVTAKPECENVLGGEFSTADTTNPLEITCNCDISNPCPACADPNAVRTPCATSDPCECIDPNNAIRGCHMTSLHLGDVYNFFNNPPASCSPVTMPATAPDFGCGASYIHAQRYWELYRGDDSGTALPANCFEDLHDYLGSHGGGIGGQHPLEQLDSAEHIYFATSCCTTGGAHPITSCP